MEFYAIRRVAAQLRDLVVWVGNARLLNMALIIALLGFTLYVIANH